MSITNKIVGNIYRSECDMDMKNEILRRDV